MARKPKIEFQIVCSGHDESWHKQGQNRTHSYMKATEKKARDDIDALNDQIKRSLTPIGAECQPWYIERRTVSQWEAIDE